jgi:hypothetical protein
MFISKDTYIEAITDIKKLEESMARVQEIAEALSGEPDDEMINCGLAAQRIFKALEGKDG